MDQVLPPILILEFIFGLLGNSVALWMFTFHMDIWKPNTVYLVHLAVTDIIVLFCLPFRADYYMRGKNWIYGDVPCRILMFLLATNRAAGIFFLTAVAVDRYLRVVRPHSRINRMGLGYATLVCCCIWAIIIAMTVYLLTYSHIDLHGKRKQCESFNVCMDFTSNSVWQKTLYLLQFFIPTTIILFCTACITFQLKTKTVDSGGRIMAAVYVVLSVALVFIICFLPSTVSLLVVSILKAWYNECSYFEEVSLAFYASVCLTYFNCALNPVVYYFSSPAHRRTIRQVYHKLFRKTLQEEERGPPSTSIRPYTVS